MDMKTPNRQRDSRRPGLKPTEYKGDDALEDASSHQIAEPAVDYLQSLSPASATPPQGRRIFEKTVLPEEETLANKLAVEIEQLEVWLANQQKTEQGSISVIPTIKSLIHTRKKLLKNIQTSH